jgi:hypothetical protein
VAFLLLTEDFLLWHANDIPIHGDFDFFLGIIRAGLGGLVLLGEGEIKLNNRNCMKPNTYGVYTASLKCVTKDSGDVNQCLIYHTLPYEIVASVFTTLYTLGSDTLTSSGTGVYVNSVVGSSAIVSYASSRVPLSKVLRTIFVV